MATEVRDYTVVVHDEGDEGYWAEVEELPGCFASGMTMDELWEALAEAVGLYLSDDEGGRRAVVRIDDIQPAHRREVIEERKLTLCV